MDDARVGSVWRIQRIVVGLIVIWSTADPLAWSLLLGARPSGSGLHEIGVQKVTRVTSLQVALRVGGRELQIFVDKMLNGGVGGVEG